MPEAVVPAVRGATRDATLVMRAVAESLRRHVDDLAAELVGLVLANESAYAAGRGSVDERDLYASCRANLDRVLQMLAGTVPSGEDPLDAARATGRRRAAQLLPLGALLHSYRLGGQLVWRGLVHEGRSTAAHSVTSDELVEIASSVWDVVDQGAMAATEAYRSAEWEVQQRDESRRAAVLESLLEGRGASGAAEMLGIAPHGRYVVVVLPLVDGEPPRPPDPELRQRGLTSSWHPYRGMQVGLVALGCVTSDHEVRRALTTLLPGPAGLSPPVTGLNEVSHAYRLAQVAHRSVPPGSDAVAWLDDRLPESLVAASPELALRLADRLLGPLRALGARERDTLLQTLHAWLEHDGSPSRVAAELFCHRNTVLKRVHRIEALTRTSLTDLGDLAAWRLALFADRLYADVTG